MFCVYMCRKIWSYDDKIYFPKKYNCIYQVFTNQISKQPTFNIYSDVVFSSYLCLSRHIFQILMRIKLFYLCTIGVNEIIFMHLHYVVHKKIVTLLTMSTMSGRDWDNKVWYFNQFWKIYKKKGRIVNELLTLSHNF